MDPELEAHVLGKLGLALAKHVNDISTLHEEREEEQMNALVKLAALVNGLHLTGGAAAADLVTKLEPAAARIVAGIPTIAANVDKFVQLADEIDAIIKSFEPVEPAPVAEKPPATASAAAVVAALNASAMGGAHNP